MSAGTSRLPLWALPSLRAAYHKWQAKEDRLTTARQHLAREYLMASSRAGQLKVSERQGILREARLLLDQPLSSETLAAKRRLERAFALTGKGFWRRVPAALEVELAQYADAIEQVWQRHEDAAAKLGLARQILATFSQDPDLCRAYYYRLAVISPEAAVLLFLLRRQRRANRRATQAFLPV